MVVVHAFCLQKTYVERQRSSFYKLTNSSYMPLKLPFQDVSPSSQFYQHIVKDFSIWMWLQMKTTMVRI